jgi:hypothetical protein
MADSLTSEEQFAKLSLYSKVIECYRTVSKMTYRSAAKKYQINHRTLKNRILLKTRRRKSIARLQQRLTLLEENVIEDMAIKMYNLD